MSDRRDKALERRREKDKRRRANNRITKPSTT
jgi:hypothetical protein